jgi:hypothetical protein
MPFAGPGFGPNGPHPFFGGPALFGPGGPVAAAAHYLGLSNTQLFNDLGSGHSLAQIAKSKGKSVAGLERAITTAVKSRLDQAVSAGHISKSQEQRFLSMLSSGLSNLVNRTEIRFGPPGASPGAEGPWAHPHAPGSFAPPGI